nr:hypothetical protein [Tanacetum cinerariifolium]
MFVDINKSSVEYTEDNSNDEDNEKSHSVEKEQNTKDSDLVKTPTVKKRGRPKKIVRDNENKTPSVKRRGRPRKNNNESKKQTIGSKRKGREYKVEDDDDNEAKVKRKRNQKNNKRKIVDESSSEFEVTTTSSKDVDRKKCLYEMGFGSLIGMAIHELLGMLGFYVIDNLDTETNVLSLTDNSILVNLQSVHDILGIPMGGCSLESLESRSPDDPFIKEEKLDEGLSRFPDCKKLNMFYEKFEETTTGIDNDDTTETTTGIDNDDTTGIEKESDSPDFQIESDSPASNDDNQKSDFQVLFHKESGNSDLQRMKNKERNEEVHHILNEDDKVDDSCPTAGVCSVIKVDEVKLSEVEDLEKEKQQIGNEDDRVVDDSDTTIPNSVTEGKGLKFIKNENVFVDGVPKEKQLFRIQLKEVNLHSKKRRKKISNEELRSESFKGNVGAEDAVDSQDTIEDIFKQDEQIQSAEDVGCFILDLDDDKLDVYNGPDLHSPYEYLPVDVKKPVSDRKVFVQYLYYVKHPKAEAIEKAKIKRMKISWRTMRNSIDCGVFTMLHMESYIGAEGEWKCGLAKESKKQNEQLNSLRSKFAAKIILSEFNLLREKFMKLVQAFEQKTEEERKKIIDDAVVNMNHREEI